MLRGIILIQWKMFCINIMSRYFWLVNITITLFRFGAENKKLRVTKACIKLATEYGIAVNLLIGRVWFNSGWAIRSVH